MAKVPRAGNVKTRLQPFLSAGQCATLAEAFLSDAIYKTRGVSDSLIVAFAPDGEKSYFDRFEAENLTLLPQRGADLGEKMGRASAFACRENSDAQIVLIGTDSPTFPVAFIEDAFEFLETGAEMVLGKAGDGGFYLIGSKREFRPPIFEKVEWSSAKVFERTTENIERLKINLKLVSAWYDVDAPNDLQRLREEILKNEDARKIAPQTFRWLVEHRFVFDADSNF